MRRLEEYRRAIALQPSYLLTHRNLTTCLQKWADLPTPSKLNAA
jgi:hypothetical protein